MTPTRRAPRRSFSRIGRRLGTSHASGRDGRADGTRATPTAEAGNRAFPPLTDGPARSRRARRPRWSRAPRRRRRGRSRRRGLGRFARSANPRSCRARAGWAVAGSVGRSGPSPLRRGAAIEQEVDGGLVPDHHPLAVAQPPPPEDVVQLLVKDLPQHVARQGAEDDESIDAVERFQTEGRRDGLLDGLRNAGWAADEPEPRTLGQSGAEIRCASAQSGSRAG